MGRRDGYAKGKLSKELILDTASELFGDRGYSATSLRDIAKNSGMTHSGLLHHFPSKVALLTAILERRDDKAYAKLDEDHPVKEPTELLKALVQENTDEPDAIRLFTMLAAESTSATHPAHEYFLNRYRTVGATASEVVQCAQDAGEIRSDISANGLARLIMALMDGLQLQWLLEENDQENPVDMLALVEEFIGLIQLSKDEA